MASLEDRIKDAAWQKFVDGFWARVTKRGPDECWSWIAACGKGGYGHARLPRIQTSHTAHRIAYEIEIGDGRLHEKRKVA